MWGAPLCNASRHGGHTPDAAVLYLDLKAGLPAANLKKGVVHELQY